MAGAAVSFGRRRPPLSSQIETITITTANMPAGKTLLEIFRDFRRPAGSGEPMRGPRKVAGQVHRPQLRLPAEILSVAGLSPGAEAVNTRPPALCEARTTTNAFP